jgi:hypothetical protein
MCERTCPNCGGTEHYHLYGIGGSYILDECGTILANRRDIDAAPLGLDETATLEWRRVGTFVLKGAEAKDPKDDEIYKV